MPRHSRRNDSTTKTLHIALDPRHNIYLDRVVLYTKQFQDPKRPILLVMESISANRMKISFKGRVTTSPQYKNYKMDYIPACAYQLEMYDPEEVSRLVGKRLKMEVIVHHELKKATKKGSVGDYRHIDIDNPLKPAVDICFDALNTYIGTVEGDHMFNDNVVDEVTIKRVWHRYGTIPAHFVEVYISVLPA